ncbi:glycerol transporter [Methylobacterium sp. Leaf113]|uniref:MIP/aquaporin family protein n=1 Tax=unclassified Methylobacterium TaxID=2615210 RepID=UPI0006F670E6|nr:MULTISPECIES: MIP/aquaporin family protein [unclassified Methylobacterium]KQP89607.1 glycerol transporter [Methylobacterium sp. Leaf113]KQP91899.1 glycerol transporter [Methylobacterium sp. Leaf117]
MTSPFLGELLGTMVLIILGNGVVAGALLRGSKAEGAGWIAITAGWAFAVLAGIFVATAAGSPDAQINPAVTLAAAITSGRWDTLVTYVPAQMIGAFLGATVVWLHYLPHWAVTADQGAKRACFCTDPAIRHPIANWVSEIVGTFLLILIVGALLSRSVGAAGSIPTGLAPYLIGMVVWGIGLSLGGTTGYAINPARDLGPRLAHAILPIAGKGDSDWGYALIPVAGPAIGATLAALVVLAIGF